MPNAPGTADPPVRVAIIGGGCASMTTAFELTRPELAGRYAVTVFQPGWRLGGKGASGRGKADRIEEHGLHLWMGFYENAFRIMRECYAELDRDPTQCAIADWQDAFVPAPVVGVAGQDPDGTWHSWMTELPPLPGLPGDPPYSGPRWTVMSYVSRSIKLVRGLFATIQRADHTTTDSRARITGGGSRAAVIERMSKLLDFGELATLGALVEAAALLEVVLGSLRQYPENLLLRFVDAMSSNARTLLEARIEHDPTLRHIWEVIDLVLATLRGEIRFGILTDPRGFEAIDEYDCREWLLLNGASQSSVDSPFVRGLYDLGFSYEDGDVSRPRIAAGQALRGTLRSFFTYRGSFFWKMTAGMGDIVFAPLYEVLKRRGVRFEFFHRLDNVVMANGEDADGDATPHVRALEFDLQAEVLGGGEYSPLVTINDLPCWPSVPDYAQLVDGGRIESEGWAFESHWEVRRAAKKTLRVGDDFDQVVLGVGLGTVPHVCKELIARDPRWRAMVDHVKSVPTQAFQIWMREEMSELGWEGPPVNLSGFVKPFDTWADMRHLLRHESWDESARSLAYFCSVLPAPHGPTNGDGTAFIEEMRAQVARNAVRFLNRDVGHLWPEANLSAGEFRWELLVDPDEADVPLEQRAKGEARFQSQYHSANVNPTDHYTLSLPGSLVYRISPLDPTYDNLTVAGDWTDCGFNAGCVEAAVMSGRLASHAISQSPPLEEIVGYDHP